MWVIYIVNRTFEFSYTVLDGGVLYIYIYIYIYGEMADFGESDKMIKNQWKKWINWFIHFFHLLFIISPEVELFSDEIIGCHSGSARAMPSGTSVPGKATQGGLVWHP